LADSESQTRVVRDVIFFYDKTMEPTLIKHVESRPGVCGGKPCIVGTRIRVQDIYIWHELEGKTPDAIASDFPQLTLADIHAALAYYWDNREEIDRQMDEAENFVAGMKAKYPSKLQEELAAQDAQRGPIPPG
jgi:uncharacterized protein (DUF433 family)